MSYEIFREFEFSYAHRLLHHSGKCRFLHGHNARVRVYLSQNSLDSQGMVMDFAELKQVIQQWVEQNWDHQTLLQQGDPLLKCLQELGQPVYESPEPPTAEVMAKKIFDIAQQQGLPVVAVKLWETSRSCAVYRPYRS